MPIQLKEQNDEWNLLISVISTLKVNPVSVNSLRETGFYFTLWCCLGLMI